MKKLLCTILLLIFTVSVFAGSQGTSTTPASTIITYARWYLNETAESFWEDDELLIWVNQGTMDIVARTRCLEGTEDVTLIANTAEYTLTGPYIAVTTVIYNNLPAGTKKGLIRKNPQSILHSRDNEPSFWYDWAGKIGIIPVPKIITDANLAIGSTTTAVYTGAISYYINDKVYTKAAVAAGTAPGDDVVPQSKYGAVALDMGADGTIDAVEAYGNVVGYTTAVLAVSALPPVAKGHIRLGTVTATKSDGTFVFGTTALNAANTTVAYLDSIPTVTVYFVSTPSAVAIGADVLVPAIYDRALTLYVASQALFKEGQYAKAGRLMAEYLAELDRYRMDFIDVPKEPESNVTR